MAEIMMSMLEWGDEGGWGGVGWTMFKDCSVQIYRENQTIWGGKRYNDKGTDVEQGIKVDP